MSCDGIYIGDCCGQSGNCPPGTLENCTGGATSFSMSKLALELPNPKIVPVTLAHGSWALTIAIDSTELPSLYEIECQATGGPGVPSLGHGASQTHPPSTIILARPPCGNEIRTEIFIRVRTWPPAGSIFGNPAITFSGECIAPPP